MKNGKVNLVFILSIFCILVSGLSICKAKKVAKAEEEGQYYYINAVQSIPVNNYNNLTTRSPLEITAEQSTQGILYTEDYETEYKISKIIIANVNPSGIQFNLRLFDNDNTYIGNIKLTYTYNSTTQEREYTGATQSISENSDITAQTIFTTKWKKGSYVDTYLQNNTEKRELWNYLIQYGILQEYTETIIQLDKPTISLNQYTINWNNIENAEYYNVFLNGDLIGQPTTNSWITSANGNYTVQACTTNPDYSNSQISNTVTQNRYNDVIGNGWNFYTLIGAVLDSEIILFKSLLNYEIFGINLFIALQIILTLCLVIIIIKKFVVKG